MTPEARADWFIADVERLAEEEPDPFDQVEVGKPVNLDDREGFLNARLMELDHRERRLTKAGVTCELKEMSWTCCLGCPISEHAVGDSRLGRLCRISRESEAVVTELAVFDWRRNGRR